LIINLSCLHQLRPEEPVVPVLVHAVEDPIPLDSLEAVVLRRSFELLVSLVVLAQVKFVALCVFQLLLCNYQIPVPVVELALLVVKFSLAQ